jgi:hypothetical protein
MPARRKAMIPKAISFFIWFLISFPLLLGTARPTWADSLEELKKALQGNNVEVAWKAVDGMPQKIYAQQREETVKVLTKALKRE